MNTVIMLVLSIKVGLFGLISTNESNILFENREQCISHLDILEHKYKSLEVIRNENTLKITERDNHSIYIFKCL
ncbi:hypothetical protein [Pseudomonas phage PhiPizzaParty]|nr:hypothetical protein [Pseudomonas phage PhiPizzaParty]